jgi:hypothetical protein
MSLQTFDVAAISPEPAVRPAPRAFAYSGPRGLACDLPFNTLAGPKGEDGALSSPAGKVEISWLEEPAEKGCRIWKEWFGPEVVEPSRAGFASRLLRTAMQPSCLSPTVSDARSAFKFSKRKRVDLARCEAIHC